MRNGFHNSYKKITRNRLRMSNEKWAEIFIMGYAMKNGLSNKKWVEHFGFMQFVPLEKNCRGNTLYTLCTSPCLCLVLLRWK